MLILRAVRPFLIFLALLIAVLFTLRVQLPTLWPHSTTTFHEDLPMVVEQIQSLARLETASFHGEKIIEARSTTDPLPAWLVGDRVLLVAHGTVTAGVDLSTIRPEDVRVEGDRVRIRLPHAVIFSVQLDDRSFVYDHHPGLLSRTDPDLETRARQEAEEQFRSAAGSSQLLTRADQNARATIEHLLKAAGARDVLFEN